MIERLSVLAPGLLGGSVARAARERSAARRIVVWARRPETRLALKGQPWCDSVVDTPEEAAAGADLVIIASPVDRIVPLAAQIGPHLRPGAIVSDVGSVKGEICKLGHDAVAPRGNFVGAHPMAGSDKTGWENASPTLFERRTCFVTPGPKTDPHSVSTLVEFWRDLGAEVVTVEPDRHDEIVAHISHLPQVLASTLCAFLAGRNPAWRNLAGGGLRDTTRIAGSDPKLWTAILEQNRDEILRVVRSYQDELHSFQAALANRDYTEVAARLERGKAYRDHFRP